jgi:DNA-binding CsgD family transcriptional regulator
VNGPKLTVNQAKWLLSPDKTGALSEFYAHQRRKIDFWWMMKMAKAEYITMPARTAYLTSKGALAAMETLARADQPTPMEQRMARLAVRDRIIVQERAEGLTLKAIGERHGINKGRVKEIVNKAERIARRKAFRLAVEWWHRRPGTYRIEDPDDREQTYKGRWIGDNPL